MARAGSSWLKPFWLKPFGFEPPASLSLRTTSSHPVLARLFGTADRGDGAPPMTDKEKAAAAKAKGNAAFQAKNIEEAIKHFTEAISHDGTDHVFYSNRSACYSSLEQYEEALQDGAKCVSLKPDWPKGYTRKGLAEFFLRKYDESAETYKAGLKLAPEDASMKEGLQKAMDAKYEAPGAGTGGGGGGGGMFGWLNPAALASAAAKNPKIKEYMQDKELMQKFNMISQVMQQDPRVIELYMATQGIDVSTMSPDVLGRGAPCELPPAASRPSEPKKPKTEEPPPPEDNRTPEQKEADEFKAKGNETYKKKQFEEALTWYDKAIEKEPNDLVYYNNKCAVWIESGEQYYDKVLETCQDLITRRYEINSANPGGASSEKVAKVLNRMASVHAKRKEFDQAIECFNKALTEDNNRQTRHALRELEQAKEKFEKELYSPLAQVDTTMDALDKEEKARQMKSIELIASPEPEDDMSDRSTVTGREAVPTPTRTKNKRSGRRKKKAGASSAPEASEMRTAPSPAEVMSEPVADEAEVMSEPVADEAEGAEGGQERALLRQLLRLQPGHPHLVGQILDDLVEEADAGLSEADWWFRTADDLGTDPITGLPLGAL